MKISVAITNFNYGRYVGEAIDSVLAQTVPAHQIVVVDDGSTDDSPDILKLYRGRANVILQENAGPAQATNVAIGACDGDIVCLLDADDLMVPARLERVAAAYSENSDVEWVFHEIQHIDRRTRTPQQSTPQVPRYTPGPVDVRARAQTGDMSLPVLGVATSGLSWRTPFLTSLLPIPSQVHVQDNYLKFASYALARGYLIGDVLSLQGIHGANIYTTGRGNARRRIRAENAVATSIGYNRLVPELAGIADGLIAAALFLSRGGHDLRVEYRRALYNELGALPKARKARVTRFVLRSLAVEMYHLAQRLRPGGRRGSPA